MTRSTRFARQVGIIKPNPNPTTNPKTLTEEINKHLRTRLRDCARAMARMRVIWHCELFDNTPGNCEDLDDICNSTVLATVGASDYFI